MDRNNFIMSYSVDKNFDSDQFLKLRLRVCHDGESPNKTYFTVDTMREANKSLEYIPLLAHVYVDPETGKPTIGSHDAHVEEDKLNDGESRIIYDEQPIGVIPALSDNNCTIEEFEGMNYTFVDAFIWRDYANYAEQIVEDAVDTKLSMEIDFPDEALSYDAANDRYNIASYRYRGITLLNESLGTGMKNAMATVGNFSNNEDIKAKIVVLMDELQKCLRNYAHDDNTVVDADGSTETEAVTEDASQESTATFDEQNVDVGSGVDEFVENTPEDLVCTFRISHDDTRYGLQSLLNAMCDESHFYCIESVYDRYFYYCDYFSGNAFKQHYKVRKDVVSFDGDPEPVYREFVTQAERDELESMRKNYAELVQFKANVEAKELQDKKDSILNRKEYSILDGDAAFNELRANSASYTIDELEVKADVIFAKFVKTNNSFSSDNGSDKPKVIGFGTNKKNNKKKKAYGTLFDE